MSPPDITAEDGNPNQVITALSDSLQKQHERIAFLEDQLRRERKLQPLLMDNRIGLWEADEQAMFIRFGDPVAAQDVSDLVAAFNERNAGSMNPALRLISMDDAVARVGVSDDAQLGERMGSTGSEMFVSTMTYTLTSLPRIDSVYLDIQPGSHAGPGYYSRRSWLDLIEDD